MLDIIVLVLSVLVIFIPVIVAIYRKHHKTPHINLVILVGGITMSLCGDEYPMYASVVMGVLWLVAMGWSMNKDTPLSNKERK